MHVNFKIEKIDKILTLFLTYFVALYSLKICGALCSSASVSEKGVLSGDASEKAILNFLYKFDDPVAIRERYPKVAEIPFNSVNKYQVSVQIDARMTMYK